MLLGNIVNQYDPNILPSAVKETHDMEVQAQLAREEIPVLRTRLAELKKQKASESSDIYYGLTDNTKRNALDAEIAEVEEELRTRLAVLKKQKASETSDIYYGLTDNSKRNALDAEIAEVEEELRKQANKVEIYARAKNTTYNFMAKRGAASNNADMPYSSNKSVYSQGLIHYCCAPADAYITKINVSDKTLVFKSGEVMTIQPEP